MSAQCIDCVAEGITTRRPITHGGPRSPLCTTHHRARRKAVSARSHALRTEKTYGISADDYWALYEAQGGKCAVCQRATGATRRLAVDHEHGRPGCEHPPDVGCRNCIRGCLCSTCNVIVVGRYDIHALARAIQYLVDPPAQKVLNPHHEETHRATG